MVLKCVERTELDDIPSGRKGRTVGTQWPRLFEEKSPAQRLPVNGQLAEVREGQPEGRGGPMDVRVEGGGGRRAAAEKFFWSAYPMETHKRRQKSCNGMAHVNNKMEP
jgi:hypothetical protein